MYQGSIFIFWWQFWLKLLTGQLLTGGQIMQFVLAPVLWPLALLPVLLIVYLMEPWVLADDLSRRTRWLFRFTSAIGVAGLLVMGLGVMGWLSYGALLGVMAGLTLGVLGLRIKFKRGRGFVISKWKAGGKLKWTLGGTGLGILLAVVMPIIFYHALSWPIVEWDALTNSAPTAKQLYYHGKFSDLAGVSLGYGMVTGYPALHPSVGAYGYYLLQSDNDILLRALTPILYGLLIWGVYELGRELKDRRLGLVAALFVALTPAVIYAAIVVGYIVLLGLLVTMTLLFLARAQQRGDKKDWLVAGWYLGLSGLVSYNGYFPAAAMVLAAMGLGVAGWWKKRVGSVIYELRNSLMMGGLAFLINIGWWVRNFIVYGTPWQPFLTPSKVLAEFNVIRTATNLSNIYYSVLNFGTTNPSIDQWIKTFFWQPSGFPSASWLVLLGVLMVVAMLKKSGWWYLVGVVVTYWLTPILQPAHHDRTVLIYAGALAVLAAWPVYYVLVTPNKKWLWWAGIGVMSVLLVIKAGPVLMYGKKYHPFWGFNGGEVSWDWALRRENMVSENLIASRYPYQSWKYINEHLSEGMRVAVTGVPGSYYIAGGDLEKLFFLDSMEAMKFREMETKEEVMRFLDERQVEYIFWWDKEFDRYSYEGYALPKFLGDEDLPEVAHRVYKVRDGE